jgi:hypothetical protein
MNNLFSIALVAQTFCAITFCFHRFVKPLGSDLMFAVFIASLMLSVYLLWQSLRNPNIIGTQKTLGIVLSCIPFVWLLVFALFVGTTKM